MGWGKKEYPPLSSLSFLISGFCLCLEKKFLDLLCGWTCLWVCVYVLVCMINIMCLWVWFSGFEKSVHMLFFFFLIKLPMCFCEEEKTLLGHDGGDWRCYCLSEVILQAGCQCRSALGEVEIGDRWISFARDQRCLDSMRWKSALFGLGERKRMEGQRRVCIVCLGIGGEWLKKNKKGEKGIYGEREDTHRYGNHELDMVLKQWVPQKVQIFEWWEVEK